MTLRLHRPVEAGPCFHVVTLDGKCPPDHEEGCPHHDTVEQAMEEPIDYYGDDPQDWEVLGRCVVPLAEACWVVECDGRDHGKGTCEDKYSGSDQWGASHFESASDADMARDGDWVLARHTDGQTYAVCPEARWQFTDDAESDEHAVLMHLGLVEHAEDYEEPVPPPGPQDVPLPYPQDRVTLAALGERHGFTVTD